MTAYEEFRKHRKRARRGRLAWFRRRRLKNAALAACLDRLTAQAEAERKEQASG